MKKNLLFFASFFCAVFIAPAQVIQLNNNGRLEVSVPIANNKTILFSGIDGSIWSTDATQAGTIKLSPDIIYDDDWALLSGKAIFIGGTPATGDEIYITDGTPAGTLLVKDINPGTADSDPGDLVLLNGFIYFMATTPNEGRELWRTDGTPNGTTLIKDVLPGTEGSSEINDDELFSNGSYLLFAAKTVSSGIELWKSDGTNAGTVLLKDINAGNLGADSSNPREFFKYNNTVLFIARDFTHGEEFWKTDGTPGGTQLLRDINPGIMSSTSIDFGFPFPLFLGFHLFNNRVYFNATNGNGRGQIWSSDGTEANTLLLKDFSLSFVSLIGAMNVANKFIFAVSDGTSRFELWESDGTPANTKLFKSFSNLSFILPSYNYDFDNRIITQSLFQGNKFFFIASTESEGSELWITDGVDSTPAHTHIAKDIYPGAEDGIVSSFTSYVYTSAHLYFSADNGSAGNELWRSDGTNGGTTLVQDIYPGGESSDPELPFFVTNGKIIFTANDGDDANTDLYVVDGNFSPLPIKLSEFTVRLKANDALLQWSTLNELNSKDFTIQRSYDGRHFEPIATVPASNASSLKHNYSFTDKDITNSGNNIIYYRIIAADKDGKTETTNVIFVKLKGDRGWTVKLLTNPVQNFAALMLNGITKEVQFYIKDIGGRVFYSSSRQNVNGQISIPTANLPRGMYVLIAESNNEKQTIQFIKQ